jgi:hypothetical protein
MRATVPGPVVGHQRYYRSMRPRHECLGKQWRHLAAGPCKKSSLQRGRGGNASENRGSAEGVLQAARASMRPIPFHVLAQGFASMRPRRNCLGKHRRGQGHRRLRRASMKPRDECLGKHAIRQRGLSRPNAASMRPRHQCLGKPDPFTLSVIDKAVELQ